MNVIITQFGVNVVAVIMAMPLLYSLLEIGYRVIQWHVIITLFGVNIVAVIMTIYACHNTHSYI